ncbi:MAG: hypothetical protein ACYDG5_00685 [Dehalococcoidales bacterium]
MNFKTGKDKPKAGYKVIDSSARCITCTKPCSMSGLCMKQWPEFEARGKKGRGK